VHKIQINVIGAERFQGRINPLLDSLMPRVIELGGEENLFSWDT
jgi:hypothetical protein